MTEPAPTPSCKPNCVSEPQILDLAWKYFQQHAQQRLSFFNFFVVFSALMTTGLLSTFQQKYDAHYIGIAVGLMLSLISFVFWKIDERNKYLTKMGEDAIKAIEHRFPCKDCYLDSTDIQIFSREERDTNALNVDQLERSILSRQISHSKSFNLIFLVFFVVGLLGAATSTYYQLRPPPQNEANIQQQLRSEIDGTNMALDKLRQINNDLDARLNATMSKETPSRHSSQNEPSASKTSTPPGAK